METNSKSVKPTENERRTLEEEYRIAYQLFQINFSQGWLTFSIASTLSVAGLAFVGQVKANPNNVVTWPLTLVVGGSMIVVLLGWLSLAKRWWIYGRVALYRMEQIENVMEMYTIRGGNWLRKPLSREALAKLSNREQKYYKAFFEAFPKFPKFRWRQEVIASVIVYALIAVWIGFIVADILALI